jgi:hypothetical protein
MTLFKTENGYLQSIEDITLEKSSKLFEKLDNIKSDVSYELTFPRTQETIKALDFPMIDTLNKTIYKNVFADVIGSDGETLYKGLIRIEGVNKREVHASFLSGNYNWTSLIDGNLTDLYLADLDVELNSNNIIDSWDNDEEIKFPFIDAGSLLSRSWHSLMVEDFVGTIYAKTIFKRIFWEKGIKLKGELINDPVFNSIIVCKNNKNKDEIEKDSCYVNKTNTTARPVENVKYKVTFDDDSTAPFFDGANNCFDLANSRFTAHVPMRILLECTLTPSIVDASYNNRIYLYINGAYPGFLDVGLAGGTGGLYNSGTAGDQSSFTMIREIFLDKNDTLEIYSEWQQSLGSTQNDVASGTLKITPLYIYQVTGKNVVPNWTKKQFVSNIFNLFNVVTDFDPVTKELTINFFDRIKTKTPVDISRYVDPDSIETDYVDFISGFAKKNYLKYANTDPKDVTQSDELRKYNVSEFLKYGQGLIEVDNDFIPPTGNIIENEFAVPISYIHNKFKCSLERINLLELEEKESIAFTSVTSSSTKASFHIASNLFLQGDLVRITNSTQPYYKGDWIVETRPSGSITLTGSNLSGGVQQLPFQGDATGTITRLQHVYTESDDVFIFIFVPSISYGDFTHLDETIFLQDGEVGGYTYAGNSPLSSIGTAFFSLIDIAKPINDYEQSLSYGDISNPDFHQKTLVESYWRTPGEILNDPVKITLKANLPKTVFEQLTPLTPIFLKIAETSNLFYRNKISGYRNSKEQCEIELIKL